MAKKSQTQAIRDALESGRVLTATDIIDLTRLECVHFTTNHKGRIDDIRNQYKKEGKGHNLIPRTPMDIPYVKIDAHTQIGLYFLKSLYTFEEALLKRFPDKAEDRARNQKGQFTTCNNPATKEVLDEAEKLYKTGANFQKVKGKFPDVSWRSLYRGLQDRGVFRHRGQQKQAELFATGAR